MSRRDRIRSNMSLAFRKSPSRHIRGLVELKPRARGALPPVAGANARVHVNSNRMDAFYQPEMLRAMGGHGGTGPMIARRSYMEAGAASLDLPDRCIASASLSVSPCYSLCVFGHPGSGRDLRSACGLCMISTMGLREIEGRQRASAGGSTGLSRDAAPSTVCQGWRTVCM